MKHFRCLILLALLFFAPSSAQAAAIFFDNSIGDCVGSYNPTTRACGTGSDTSYTDPQEALLAIGYSAGAGANDFVYGRAGTYQPTVPVGGHNEDFFPSGSSWSAPFTFAPYNCEAVTIRANGAERNLWLIADRNMFAVIGSETFGCGFIFDGTNTTNDSLRLGNSGQTPSQVRIVGNKFLNTEKENAIYIGFHGVGIEIRRNECTGGAFFTTANNAGVNHCLYHTASGSIIEENYFHDVPGFGIHIYCSDPGASCSNNIVRRNRIRRVGTNSATVSGIIAWPQSPDGGGGNEIYNNQVWDISARDNDGGIGIGVTGTGSKVYGNTIYNVTWMGINYSGSGHDIKNNIVIMSSVNDQITGSGATLGTNFCSNSHANCPFFGNPLFVDAPNGDFRLSPTSSAIDQGTALGSPYNVDIAGTFRPQGAAWDIGAFEGSSSSTPPSCPAVANALVASYAFDGNGVDATGRGHTANVSSVSFAAGKYGQAASFGGSAGIAIPDHDDFDFCGGFTLAAWVKIPATSGDYAIMVKRTDKYFLYANITGYCGAANPLGGYFETSSNNLCYGTALATAAWVYLTLTYDNTLGSNNLKLYLDGVSVTSANGTALLSASSGILDIGTSEYGEHFPSGGLIDEVRLYNYPRTVGEITIDMNTPIGVIVATPVEIRISGGTIWKFGPSVIVNAGIEN